MIVVCEMRQNGVSGRKVTELTSYLRQFVEKRCVPDMAAYKVLKQFISRKVSELNQNYPKSVMLTVTESFSQIQGSGTIRICRPKSSTPIIYMEVLEVKDFKE